MSNARFVYFLIIIIVLSSLFYWDEQTLAQTPMLPSDLLFIGQSDTGPALYLLDRVTLTSQLIWHQANIQSILAISWSPSGNQIAMFAIPVDYPPLYVGCVISVDGLMSHCFNVAFEAGPFHTVTWSDDEQSVLFLAQTESMRQIIQVDVMTGETARVVYEFEYIPPMVDGEVWWNPPDVIWTADLQYVAVGVNQIVQPVRYLVDLETSKQYDLKTLVEPLSFYAGGHESPQSNTGYICPQFSPDGKHLTAVELSHKGRGDIIHLFDMDSQIATTIDDYHGALPLAVGCPVWDKRTIYFASHVVNQTDDWRLYSYSIDSHVLSWVASSNSAYLDFAPQDSYIAYSMFVDDRAGLYLMLPDGSIQPIATDAFAVSLVRWRPR